MTVSHDTIFSRFLAKIKDYSFLSLPSDTAYDFMREWLHSTVSKPHIRKLFESISLDDEIMTIQFTLVNTIDDEYDLDFVIEVLVQGMMIEWLTPRVNSMENISQMFSGSEEKFYSQSSHLSEIQTLLKSLKNEQRKLTRNHGYDFDIISKR